MNPRFSILLLVIVLIGWYSCKNNDEVFKKQVTTAVNIVNASVDTLNFYLNGTRQNNSSSLYPGGQSFYLTEPSGLQNYQFKKVGAAPVLSGAIPVLFSAPFNLTDSMYNSIYVYGGSAGDVFKIVDQLIPDTLHLDSTQVKFVNASPDAGNLNINIGDTVSFASVAFKTSSAIQEMINGVKEIKVFQAGSTTLLKDTSIFFVSGYIYTVYSKGLLKGTGNAAFNVGVAINYNQ